MKIKRIFVGFSNNEGMNAVSTEKLVAFAKKLEDAKHPQIQHDFYNPEPKDEPCIDHSKQEQSNACAN